MFESSDGGASWSVLDRGLPEAPGTPWLLSLDPGDRHTLFMAPSGKGFYMLSQRCVFADGFETGDVSGWSGSVP